VHFAYLILIRVQRLLNAVSPNHGRILIYVWAIEQDELSTRQLPQVVDEDTAVGRDVFVPWVLSPSLANRGESQLSEESGSGTDGSSRIFNRYYHMFAKDELSQLVYETASELGMMIGARKTGKDLKGVEIVQSGWERSNYFVELKCWTT
jgi:tRNA (uracil-5-)-methyltransferase TRM9